MEMFDINKIHENTKKYLCSCYGDISNEYEEIKDSYESDAIVETFIPIFIERKIKERYETI